MKFSQAQIYERIELLITNGQRPSAQTVLGVIGYLPQVLSNTGTQLQAWRSARAEARAGLAAQKAATKAEWRSREEAEREVVDLSQTIRLLFKESEEVLTAVGLLTHYETVIEEIPFTVGAEEGTPIPTSTLHAVRPSRATAETLARWRLLVDNSRRLSGPHLTELEAVGWNRQRMADLGALVEAYAQANIAQQEAIAAYQIASATAIQLETELRAWYTTAVNLIRLALKRLDARNSQQLQELLGLASD